MLQRIQSIYILLAVILNLTTLFVPVWQFTNQEQTELLNGISAYEPTAEDSAASFFDHPDGVKSAMHSLFFRPGLHRFSLSTLADFSISGPKASDQTELHRHRHPDGGNPGPGLIDPKRTRLYYCRYGQQTPFWLCFTGTGHHVHLPRHQGHSQRRRTGCVLKTGFAKYSPATIGAYDKLFAEKAGFDDPHNAGGQSIGLFHQPWFPH
jgi:hypothetical protein